MNPFRFSSYQSSPRYGSQGYGSYSHYNHQQRKNTSSNQKKKK